MNPYSYIRFFMQSYSSIFILLPPTVFQNRRNVFFRKTIWSFRKTRSVIPAKFRFAKGIFREFFLCKRPTRPFSRGIVDFDQQNPGCRHVYPCWFSKTGKMFSFGKQIEHLGKRGAHPRHAEARRSPSGARRNAIIRLSFLFSQAAAG